MGEEQKRKNTESEESKEKKREREKNRKERKKEKKERKESVTGGMSDLGPTISNYLRTCHRISDFE